MNLRLLNSTSQDQTETKLPGHVEKQMQDGTPQTGIPKGGKDVQWKEGKPTDGGLKAKLSEDNDPTRQPDSGAWINAGKAMPGWTDVHCDQAPLDIYLCLGEATGDLTRSALDRNHRTFDVDVTTFLFIPSDANTA